SPHHKLALPGQVVGETNSGAKIVGVFVPDIAVFLNKTRPLKCTGQGSHRKERITRGYGRAKRPKINVGVVSGFKVVRRTKIIPTQSQVERKARRDLP